jgi:hypothetical protein
MQALPSNGSFSGSTVLAFSNYITIIYTYLTMPLVVQTASISHAERCIMPVRTTKEMEDTKDNNRTIR